MTGSALNFDSRTKKKASLIHFHRVRSRRSMRDAFKCFVKQVVGKYASSPFSRMIRRRHARNSKMSLSLLFLLIPFFFFSLCFSPDYLNPGGRQQATTCKRLVHAHGTFLIIETSVGIHNRSLDTAPFSGFRSIVSCTWREFPSSSLF